VERMRRIVPAIHVVPLVDLILNFLISHASLG
jgi:hypothetical protein